MSNFWIAFWVAVGLLGFLGAIYFWAWWFDHKHHINDPIE